MSKLNQRFLSLLTVLVMLISMLPMSALAEGTYEVGTVVISDTMPEGDIPEGTYWQQTAVSAVYDMTTPTAAMPSSPRVIPAGP